ncbi:MAG: hypothetical protein ABL860_06475, partial [Candidatus Nitrotoga sp.]
PALLNWSGFLINSHDPLRGHVFKHIRQNSLTSLRYSAGAQGKKSEKPKTVNRRVGTWRPPDYAIPQVLRS